MNTLVLNRQTKNRYLWFMIWLAFAARLFRLDKHSLWFDDIINVHMAKLPLVAGLDSLIAQGIQLTPQYHWITKAWLPLGDSEWILRFPSVGFSLLSIPLVFQLGRQYFDTRIGLLAAAIFALNPYQVWYAHETRAYSLLTLAAIGGMLAFARFLKRKRWSTLQLILFNMIGIGSHYFMLLLPAVQFIFLLINFKRYHAHFRRWFGANIAAGSILIPWFGFIIARQHFAVGIGWVPKPGWLEPFFTIWNFSIGYQEEASPLLVAGLIVILVAMVLGIINLKRFKPFHQLILLWIFFPLVVVPIVSQGPTSFYVDRYFLVISPALALLISVGVMTLANDKLRLGLGGAVLLATVFGLSQVYFDETHFTRDDWRTMASTLRRQAQPGDGLVTCTDGYRLALNYYGLGDHFDQQAKAHQIYYVYPASFDFNAELVRYDRLWVVVSNPRQPQHHLGFSYPLDLNPAPLPEREATWFTQHQPDVIPVAGITALVYTLSEINTPDLNALIAWNCKTS